MNNVSLLDLVSLGFSGNIERNSPALECGTYVCIIYFWKLIVKNETIWEITARESCWMKRSVL